MRGGFTLAKLAEASRGMPGLRAVKEPTLMPERAATGEAFQRSLSGLGFRHAEWFSLDDFDETHSSAWDNGQRGAFVLYFPVSGAFRLRRVRRFPSGGVLVSSRRWTDRAYPPPQGLYVQARKAAPVEELWAWHLEGEALLPDHAAAGDPRVGGVRGRTVRRGIGPLGGAPAA